MPWGSFSSGAKRATTCTYAVIEAGIVSFHRGQRHLFSAAGWASTGPKWMLFRRSEIRPISASSESLGFWCRLRWEQTVVGLRRRRVKLDVVLGQTQGDLPLRKWRRRASVGLPKRHGEAHACRAGPWIWSREAGYSTLRHTLAAPFSGITSTKCRQLRCNSTRSSSW